MLAVNMNEGVTKQHPRGLFRCPYLCLTLPLDNAAQTQGGTSEKNSFHLEPILQCSTCVVFYIETEKKNDHRQCWRWQNVASSGESYLCPAEEDQYSRYKKV